MFYDKIRPLTIDRSKFDLSHEKSFTMDMGQLIPCMIKECAPNDRWQIGNESVIRMIPLLSPVLSEINVYVHYFFVPSRYLMKASEGKWTDFISGGKDGNDATQLPRWVPTAKDSSPAYDNDTQLPIGACSYSLWDYLGLPANMVPNNAASAPLAFGKRVYNKVYNDWYRDPLLEPTEIDLDSETIRYRNLHKDYFISALLSPQLGTAPTLPIEGNLFVQYADSAKSTGLPNSIAVDKTIPNAGPSASDRNSIDGSSAYDILGVGGAFANGKPLYVDLAHSVSSDVNQLRILYATQRFMERNNVAGGCVDPSRYGDFLVAHWGIAPSDIELNRSEYIGGSKNPLLIGEVAQTSAGTDTSPQGNLSGSGMSAGRNFICNYTCKEFGYIIGIISIMPKQSYYGGIERQWLKRDKTDFLIPEFANCGETAVWKSELYYNGVFSPDANEVFGYQGVYDEYRSAHNIICGGMQKNEFLYWNVARRFSARPSLNKDFISARWLSSDDGKRIFSVQQSDFNSVSALRAIIVHFNNVCEVSRALPYYPL